MRVNLFIAACLLVACWPSAAGAQDAKPHGAADPQVAAARERYGFEQWPTGGRRAGLALGAVSVPGYAGDPVDSSVPGMVTRHFRDASKKPVFYVEAAVRETAAEAKQCLIETLAFVTTPNALPTLASSGIAAGDVGYVGFAGVDRVKIAWIALVRDNVAVRVCSVDPTQTPHPDLPSIARAIDAAIQATPKVADGAKLPRPKIAKLAIAKDRCVAGENVIVDAEVADAAGGEPSLDWVVGGAGQGYVEKRADGRWHLFTTGPGEIRLTLRATASTSTSAEATAKIVVAPK